MLIQQDFSQSSPKQIYRSEIFSLSTEIYFACNSTYTYAYTWHFINSASNTNTDLSANPTAQSSELVIQPYTLDYGVYKITFLVEITVELYGLLSNTVDTYIEIVPTGLAVFAIENGISSQLIGSSQSLILNPVAYSSDLDNYVAISSLTFEFYCTVLNTNDINPPIEQATSLRTFKTKQLTMTWNETCFNSPSM